MRAVPVYRRLGFLSVGVAVALAANTVLAAPDKPVSAANTDKTSAVTSALPSLEEVLLRAEARALGSIEARGELAAAKATKVGAEVSAFANPYVDMQIDRGSTTKDVQALAYLYMPVDLFGQRGARIDEADALVRWKGLSAEARRAAVRGEAIARWGAVRVAAERLAIATSTLAVSEKEGAYFTARFEAKDTTIYEKSLAEAEVGRWTQVRAEAELELAERTGKLGEWLGETLVATDADALAAGNAPLPPEAHHGPREAPGVAAQRAEIQFWEKQGERYRTERRAPVQLLVIAGRGDPGDVRLGGGLTVTLPVARRNQGEIARAEAEAERSEATATTLGGALAARIAASEKMLATTRTALETLDRLGIPASQRAADASNDAYKSGKVEFLQVLVARRELQSAKARRLDLVERAWRAYGEWIALTGERP